MASPVVILLSSDDETVDPKPPRSNMHDTITISSDDDVDGSIRPRATRRHPPVATGERRGKRRRLGEGGLPRAKQGINVALLMLPPRLVQEIAEVSMSECGRHLPLIQLEHRFT